MNEMKMVQLPTEVFSPIADGEYEVPGINPIYRIIVKDNAGVAMRNLKTGNIIHGTGRCGRPTLYFNIVSPEGKPSMYTVSRLLLSLRTGVPYKDTHNARFFSCKSGLPRDFSNRKPDFRSIQTIDEIEKVLFIVKEVHKGNILPLREALDECRPGLVKYLWHRHGWAIPRIEAAIPFAEEMLLEQMLHLKVFSVPKLSVWYANCIQHEVITSSKPSDGCVEEGGE